jgi:hypothetical protein
MASIVHLQWKSKLSDFFYGVEDLDISQVPDYRNCEFGQWLYSKGLTEFSAYSEMVQVESLHKEFHEKIKKLIQIPEEERKSAGGRNALEAFKKDCDAFLNLLNSVEAKAKRESI